MSGTEMDRDTQPKQKSAHPLPTRVRIVQLILLSAAVLTTFALAWWQLGRFESATGTAQNLGYALQWPAFGICFIVFYRKYIAYELSRAEEEDVEQIVQDIEPDPDAPMTEIPEDILESIRPTASAELPEQTRRRPRTQQSHGTDS